MQYKFFLILLFCFLVNLAEVDTGNFGRFERVNASLFSTSGYRDAQQIIDSISDTETPAVALKNVYNIIINALIYDIALNELDSNDVDTLISIAQQCPYYYGNAVYISRLILSFIDTTEYYNECELPPFQNGQKINNNNSEETVLNEFIVYPNPANDFITVTNPSGKPAFIEIYNYLGNKIATYKIDKAINVLSVNNLSAGMFIYRITSEEKLINADKLILIK